MVHFTIFRGPLHHLPWSIRLLHITTTKELRCRDAVSLPKVFNRQRWPTHLILTRVLRSRCPWSSAASSYQGGPVSDERFVRVAVGDPGCWAESFLDRLLLSEILFPGCWAESFVRQTPAVGEPVSWCCAVSVFDRLSVGLSWCK